MPEATLIRFLVVGVGNTLAGLLIIFAGKWLLALHDVLANFLGYAVGIGMSFVLNKRWTFGDRQCYLGTLTKFLAVIAVGYCANLVTVLLFLRALTWNSYLAQAAGIIPYAAITYWGSKHAVFTDRRI